MFFVVLDFFNFLCVLGVFQDVGNDKYMWEMKNACFWASDDFIIFVNFDNARKHENEQN